MDIPSWALELVVVGIVTFVFRVIFGLIDRNEKKSDNNDMRIDNEIKDIRIEIKELERKFVDNDRDLYKQVGGVRENAEYQRGLTEGKENE